jgi:arsenate reductase
MTTIYHNPRCSKSRATLELLQEKGIEPEIVLYLQNPPTAAALELIVQQLNVPVTDIIRFGEDRATELGLTANNKRSIEEWCELIAANPILLERPIVVHNRKARVGRPPERVLELF